MPPQSLEGFGVGLRRPFYGDVVHTRRALDFLEITPENWMGRGGLRARQLDEAAERFPMVIHGVSLNIGGQDPLDAEFLRQMKALCRRTRAAWWSDHLCYSAVGGVHFHDLFPLPFTREAVKHVAARVQQVKRAVNRPFLLENPTFYETMPGAEMDEATFLAEVVEAADCGILLDVNNIHVNMRNLGTDPHRYLRNIPLHRVKQVHVAGHTVRAGVVIDTHIGPVPDAVWNLYRDLVGLMGPVPTLVEWDDRIPPLDVVLNEVDRARMESGCAA